jgi:hypothetical protein
MYNCVANEMRSILVHINRCEQLSVLSFEK